MQYKINKIVIWGHKLHSHTHSYIHNAYYRAFISLGYNTEWYDNEDDISEVDFTKTMFITENQVDSGMPNKNDCLYIVHNIESYEKYQNVPENHIINLKCSYRDNNKNTKSFNEIQHSFYSREDRLSFFTLWATDLLPKEIQENIDNIENILLKREPGTFYHIGMANQMWYEIMTYLHSEYTLNIRHLGGVWQEKLIINEFEAMNFMQKSVLSLALQDDKQIQQHYVPCRIFKNISYGRIGCTNNPLVQHIFSDNLLFDIDIKECINKAIKFEQLSISERKEHILLLLEFVKLNHTYISRIKDLIKFITMFTDFIIADD